MEREPDSHAGECFDYEAALAEADALMDAEPETPEGVRLDQLATQIQAYEAGTWPCK